MAPGCDMIADMGMVLMMVVPCFVVVGETPLMLRMVGLFPAPPAWEVVIMVVGLPSAEDTSFRMVPAGSGPLVCGERERGGGGVALCPRFWINVLRPRSSMHHLSTARADN